VGFGVDHGNQGELYTIYLSPDGANCVMCVTMVLRNPGKLRANFSTLNFSPGDVYG